MKVKFEIGFFSVLFIVFLTLKLCGVITWPWIWVVAPLWVPIAVLVSLFLGMFFIAIFMSLRNERTNNDINK